MTFTTRETSPNFRICSFRKSILEKGSNSTELETLERIKDWWTQQIPKIIKNKNIRMIRLPILEKAAVGDLEENETDDLEVVIDSMRSQKSTSFN